MFERYKGKPFSFAPNKKKLPINTLHFENLKEFNRLYLHCKNNYREVKPTPSGGISYHISERYFERYFVIRGNQRFELVVVCEEGCYRFVLMGKKKATNTIHGTTAVRQIYKKADELGIDLVPYAVEPLEGRKIKDSILNPHIEVLVPMVLKKPISNVFHLDLKSSYASRIVEAYPELYDLYDYMYQQRKLSNEYYKHILTNSIGCFQSVYCPDVLIPRHSRPYQFAKLAKVAVNGTREKIEEYITKLKKDGFVPLLTNTDGIWYYSETGLPYHDSNEGVELGNWENDHKYCRFLMASVGAYQYIEDGVCYTVVRGKCNLDSIEPDRSKWKFGDILKIKDIVAYSWDDKKGVIELWR